MLTERGSINQTKLSKILKNLFSICSNYCTFAGILIINPSNLLKIQFISHKFFIFLQFVIAISFFQLLTLAKVNAQNTGIEVHGKVVYVENDQYFPLEFATVRLLNEKDSSLIAGTTTNEEGVFKFNAVKPQHYLVLISSVGYQNKYNEINVQNSLRSFIVADIIMYENSVTLDDAIIMGKRSEMLIKDDTLEYNAGAYKLNENAVVEDLLKRLPGITITEDGKILVNGKEVRKVMVDGKDFFRSNPNLSIKNIPAEIMEKLQIIEDKSELSKLTGVDDGEENITINITIQKDKKRGWLVSSNAGGGQELNGSEGNLLRYSVNSFAARLHDESQLGLVANGNNINGMSIGSGGSNIGSGKPGLNSSFSGGINFSSGKEKETPWLINGDISYGFNELELRKKSRRQYYLQDSTSYLTDSTIQISREQGIRFSSKIQNKALNGWTFSFSPSASFTTESKDYSGNSLLQAGNLDRDSVTKNNYNRNSISPEINLGGVFTVSHDFEKKKRKLSMSISSKYSNGEATGETDANYYYFRKSEGNRIVSRNQQWETNTSSFNNRLYLSYIEPIGLKSSLQFVYWIQSNRRENIKNNYIPDLITGEYTVLDLPYSKSIENLTMNQQLGMSYRAVSKKIVYTLGLDFNPSYIRSRSFIQDAAVSGGDSTITYFPGLKNYNFAPNAYVMYTIGKGKSIRFDYRGRSQSPTVTQLDPSPDETNPTYIRVGNPDLLPRFTHWTRLRYNDKNRKTQQSIQVNVEGNYIENDIINFTSYDGLTGVRTNMPINKSGSWNMNGMFMYSRPLSKYFQINNYTNASVKNNIGYSKLNNSSDSQETVATTASINESLGITYNWSWLYILTKLNYQLSNTTYSAENILDKKVSSMGGLLTGQFTLAKSWVISSSVNYRNITGFSSEYDRSEVIWNTEISKNFLKSKAAVLSLAFNDILQQQLSVSQVISSNYVEDQQFNTLKSFVLLAFSYKFNTLGK